MININIKYQRCAILVEAMLRSLSREWIIGNRVCVELKSASKTEKFIVRRSLLDLLRFPSFLSSVLYCICFSILPNFMYTARFRRCICVRACIPSLKRGSIVLFHRARLVGGPKTPVCLRLASIGFIGS